MKENKQTSLSFDEHDIDIKRGIEEDTVVLAVKEIGAEKPLSIYFGREEIRQLCKELLKFIEE